MRYKKEILNGTLTQFEVYHDDKFWSIIKVKSENPYNFEDVYKGNGSLQYSLSDMAIHIYYYQPIKNFEPSKLHGQYKIKFMKYAYIANTCIRLPIHQLKNIETNSYVYIFSSSCLAGKGFLRGVSIIDEEYLDLADSLSPYLYRIETELHDFEYFEWVFGIEIINKKDAQNGR